MTDSSTRPLTLTEAAHLGELTRAVNANAKLEYYQFGADTDRPLTGELRCFAHEGGGFWSDRDGDVRDAFVHVSGMMEHWFQVSHLIRALGNLQGEYGMSEPMAIIRYPEGK
jgi:hypothetical protein